MNDIDPYGNKSQTSPPPNPTNPSLRQKQGGGAAGDGMSTFDRER